jgi:hypothetical protein
VPGRSTAAQRQRSWTYGSSGSQTSASAPRPCRSSRSAGPSPPRRTCSPSGTARRVPQPQPTAHSTRKRRRPPPPGREIATSSGSRRQPVSAPNLLDPRSTRPARTGCRRDERGQHCPCPERRPRQGRRRERRRQRCERSRAAPGAGLAGRGRPGGTTHRGGAAAAAERRSRLLRRAVDRPGAGHGSVGLRGGQHPRAGSGPAVAGRGRPPPELQQVVADQLATIAAASTQVLTRRGLAALASRCGPRRPRRAPSSTR